MHRAWFLCNEKVQSRKSKNDFPFPPVCKIGGLLANTFWHLEKKKYFMAMDPGQILPRKKENSPRQYPWAGSRIFSAAFRQNIAAKILRDGRLTRYCGLQRFSPKQSRSDREQMVSDCSISDSQSPVRSASDQNAAIFQQNVPAQRSFKENLSWQWYCQFGNKPVYYDWLAGGMFTKIYSSVCSHNHNEVGRHC